MTNKDFVIKNGLVANGNIQVLGTVDGRDIAVDGIKLDGIESGATADQTAAEILTLIKTVDGAASGLDADMLDGQHSSFYTDSIDAKVAKAGDTITGNLVFNDNVKANFGTSGDLQVYHNGSNSFIDDTGTGSLYVRSSGFTLQNSAGTETFLTATDNGAINLYYDNSSKLETSSNGVTVNGQLSSDTIYSADGITSNGATVIDVATTGNALQITQTGTGNALVVEDSANPDSTPFIVKSDGKVGIGTSNPATALDVNGTITGTSLDMNGNADFGGNLNLSQATSTTIKRTDNTGILVLQSGADALSSSLVMYGNAHASLPSWVVFEGDTMILRSVDNTDFVRFIDGTGTIFNETSADLDFRIESDTHAYAFFLRGSDGNIGMGTSIPTSKLEVADLSGAVGIEVSAYRNDTTYGNSYIKFNGPRNNTGDGNTNDGRGAITLLGNSSGLQGSLWINAASSTLLPETADEATMQGYQAGLNLNSDGELSFWDNGSQRFLINSSGNFGINTSSPSEKLHISGTGETILVTPVAYSANQDSPYLIASGTTYNGATTNWSTYGFQHRLKVNSSGVPRVTIDTNTGELFSVANAGVGIGIESPYGKLDVNGTVYAQAGTLFNPPGTGTDTSTTSAFALDSGSAIVGVYNGYIRNMLSWTGSSDITIGQGGTSLIGGINLIPGSSGNVKVNGQRVFAEDYHPNADTWTTSRTVTFATGDVTGSFSIDGSGDVSDVALTVGDDSHNHIISNVDGLQTALDGKLATSAKAADSELLDGINSTSFVRSDANDDKSGFLRMADGAANYLALGSGSDFRMWHDGTNTYFRNYNEPNGDMLWQTEGTSGVVHTAMRIRGNSPTPNVELYYDNAKKIETTSSGITVTGNVTGTRFIGAADSLTTERTISLGGDLSGSATFDGSQNITITGAVANDSHSHSFANLINKESGTGNYKTTGGIAAGEGSGNVSLTINDGYGNANVNFNHYAGIPDSTGSSARITSSVDSSAASLTFQLGDSTTSGAAVALTEVVKMTSSGTTFQGTTSVNGDIIPTADGTQNVGTSANTFANGWFTNMTVDSTLNVRAAIDLADNDHIRMGSSDDWRLFYNPSGSHATIELEADATDLVITDNGTTKFTFEKSSGRFTPNGGLSIPAQALVDYTDISLTNNAVIGTSLSLYMAVTGTSNFNWFTGCDSNTTGIAGGTRAASLSDTGEFTLDTGDLSIGTSGKGIKFAGQTSVLDDYEEGTWTPTYAGAGVAGTFTYDIQEGYYTKIGNVVTVTGRLRTDAASGATGNAIIEGLPFTAKNVTFAGSNGCGSLGQTGDFNTEYPVGVYAGDNQARLFITTQPSANSTINVMNAANGFLNAANANGLFFSCTYVTG